MKDFLVNGPPPGPLSESARKYFPNYEFRPARNIVELKAAATLAYQEYTKSEFIAPNKNHWKFTLFQILPTTVTFVILFRPENRVVGTMTMVEDSPLGLPMESLYKQELDTLRLDGCHITEFTMLALDQSLLRHGHLAMSQSIRCLLLFHMIRAMFDHIRCFTKINAQVACFHPKHDNFYKMLSMRQMGALKYYGGVKGKPALARYHLLPEVVKEGRLNTTNRLFIKELEPRNIERNFQLTEEDLRELFIGHSNILASADERKLAFIKRCYPHIDFKHLLSQKSLIDYMVDALAHTVIPPKAPASEPEVDPNFNEEE